jgi:chaperonin cofactor prefoldin
LDELSLAPELVAKGVEAANSACGERQAALQEQEDALKARVATLSAPISNLVEVLKVSGLGALSEVTRELERLTTDKALVEHELRETQQQLSELRRGHIDVIGDLRLLYEAAKPEERRELMRLVIRRIVYRGPREPLGFEFFDRGAVNLPREGSKLSNEWLPNSSSSKNFATCVILDFAAERKRRLQVHVPKARVRAETLSRADEWERLLAAGEVRSRAEIARREGLSRARVTQILGRRQAGTLRSGKP